MLRERFKSRQIDPNKCRPRDVRRLVAILISDVENILFKLTQEEEKRHLRSSRPRRINMSSSYDN